MWTINNVITNKLNHIKVGSFTAEQKEILREINALWLIKSSVEDDKSKL